MIAVLVPVIWSFLFVMDEARAQVEFSRTGTRAETVFYFDAIVVISDQPGKSRIEVYIQIPYKELHFLKIGDQYLANYEATVQVLTKDRDQVAERSWKNEVSVTDFNLTTSDKRFSLAHQSLDVTPGQYEIDVEIYTPENQKRTTQRKSLLVTDFGKDELSFSDIMLLSRLTKTKERMEVVPNVSGTFTRNSGSIYLLFEAYHVSPIDSLFVVSRIYDAEKKVVWRKEQAEPPSESKIQVFTKVDSMTFPAGTYVVVVEGFNARAGTSPALKATTSRRFAVMWEDIPPTIVDIDKAIDEMRYVATNEELDSLQAGKTLDERRKRFLAFWDKRNPDPTSGRNPLLEEYYRRVDYANKAFTRYLDGWKTDRGMVYIRLGPPDNIERHPFEMGSKPYEIWYYYNLNRECIFVDYSGFGDYRLQNPSDELFRGLR
jgi:GWxTD domain-containing protein